MKKTKQVLNLTLRGFIGKEVGRRSAGLTYYLVFAIFPFVLSIISILGRLHLPMISLKGDVAAFLPADVITLLNITLVHMTAYSNGAILTFGLAFALWFPFRAVKNMAEEVADIYEDDKFSGKKRLLKVFILYVIILVFIPAMFVLLIIGEGLLSFVAQFLPITMEFITLWNKVRFLPLALALISLTSAVYALSPASRPGWHYVLPGALLSTTAWMAYSLFFAHYVNNMGNYSVIYGSIGAIIVFLIWLNWSMTALLTGAVFNQALRAANKKTPVIDEPNNK